MKSRKITFRVSEYEYEQILSMQEKWKQCSYGGKWNLSGFVRALVLSNCGFQDEEKKRLIHQMNYELRKIGVNINQIAHKLNGNIGDPRDAAYVIELMTDLNKTAEQLRKEVMKNSNHKADAHEGSSGGATQTSC